MSTKKCSRCGIVRSLKSFYGHKRLKHGKMRGECKQCARSRSSPYANKTPVADGLRVCEACSGIKKLRDFHRSAGGWRHICSLCCEAKRVPIFHKTCTKCNITKLSKEFFCRINMSHICHDCAHRDKALSTDGLPLISVGSVDEEPDAAPLPIDVPDAVII